MPPGAPARPPALRISPSSPARPLPSSSRAPAPSSSPFRYVHFPPDKLEHPLRAPPPEHPLAPAPTPASPLHPPRPRPPPPPRARAPVPPPPRARAPGIPDRLKPWLGLGAWAATSLAFLLAIAFWKTEVFTGLDRLARHLQALGYRGYAGLFCLIFITTIPPVPLYSTLIVLSGYTFGTWRGAALSYAAALSGAAAVFLLARRFLRARMARLLAHAAALQRVVRAVERRPRLLLLIRVAPYPYNLMNVLLAASHTLSFRTYIACTAASLAKVVVHTSLGASLHSFAGYAVAPEGAAPAPAADGVARAWTAAGLVLCVAIFIYLSYVARRAVDEELEGDTRPARDEEEAGSAAEMGEVAAG